MRPHGPEQERRLAILDTEVRTREIVATVVLAIAILAGTAVVLYLLAEWLGRVLSAAS